MSEVEPIVDVASELGEGPIWLADRGVIAWVDILGRRLLETGPDGGAVTVVPMPAMVSVIADAGAGRELLVSDAGLHLRDAAAGRLDPLRPYWDRPDTRSNDGRVHPSGALWISTMARDAAEGQASIWWIRGGDIRRIADGLTIPNAIAFSPDGATAYFACSRARTIWRQPLDPATGLPAGDRAVFRRDEPSVPHVPDGAVVDADGCLWNARWGAGRLDVHHPDGRLVETIAMPAMRVTCPAFTGPALDRLVVTSAYEGYDAAGRCADPLAGRLFRLSRTVRGRREPVVMLA